MGQFYWKLKRYLHWTNAEIKDLVITILVVAFIFGYNDKQPSFQISYWLFNFLLHVFIVTIIVFLYDLAHKVASIFMNIKAEYKMWSTGLLIGMVVTILSGGKFYIILPGGVFFHHLVVQRLGHFRYGLNYFTTGFLAAAGPLFLLLCATFFKTLAIGNIAPVLFDRITFIALYFAIFTMLPFPRHDGAHMFFANRNWFVIILFFLIGYIFMYKLHFYSLIFAVLIGLVAWLVFYIAFEKDAWVFG
ncbi:hypothetical protein HOC35_06020 [Candidatus Woesearchaeota archaeon]|jgi:hypothetical protein|nr:hypothetical protein [Candidatus Woesearchaeota archaeon]